jgi:hypothetical protein
VHTAGRQAQLRRAGANNGRFYRTGEGMLSVHHPASLHSTALTLIATPAEVSKDLCFR